MKYLLNGLILYVKMAFTGTLLRTVAESGLTLTQVAINHCYRLLQ